MIRPSTQQLELLEHQQRAIYYRARVKSRHQVGNVLTTRAALWTAYRDLGGARGKRTPGVDGMVYAELEPQIDIIGDSIRDRTYCPTPLRFVSIPKASGGTRRLGIPTVRDRFIQRLLLLVVAPVVERVLPLTSFACRPGFGAADALRTLELELLRDGEDIWLVRADIKDFFHNIRHRQLRSMLRERLRGGRLWHLLDSQLSAWCTARGRGLPQGAPASPPLANFYLWKLDRTFTCKLNNGIAYHRYMDDIVLVVRGGRVKAERALDELRRELGELGLHLNAKTLIASADQGVDFLGLDFHRVGDKVEVHVDDEALDRLKTRIDEHPVDLDPAPLGEVELRGESPDVQQTRASQQTIPQQIAPARESLAETSPEQTRFEQIRLEQTHFEQTQSLEETRELDSIVTGFANYFSPHDQRVMQEVSWYFHQKTGRWLDCGSSRHRPSRRGVPAWMLRLPGDRYRIDREGGNRNTSRKGVVGDALLRPPDVDTRSSVGLAANLGKSPTVVPTFVALMGLGSASVEVHGLSALDLGDVLRKAAGARRWLGATLGKVQQAISESRRRRKAMGLTAKRSLEDQGYFERGLVDAALDRSSVYRDALEEEHHLALSVQRLREEVSRADIFSGRLQIEMDNRRRGVPVLCTSSACVDADRSRGSALRVSRGLYVRQPSCVPSSPSSAIANCGLGSTLSPWALILTTVDQHPGMSLSELLQRPEIVRRGWSHLQMAEYLEQMVRGELLDGRRVSGAPTVMFPR